MKKNQKVEELLQEIRSRGGVAGIADHVSDGDAERFLEKILDCPDCKELAERTGRVPPSRKDH